MNDTHSQLEGKSLTLTFAIQGNQEQTGVVVGGYPRLIGKLEALRANNSAMLTLHAGDAAGTWSAIDPAKAPESGV